MKIHQAEIKDGVADIVQNSASLAYCMPATLCEHDEAEQLVIAEKIKADSGNPKQVDLFYLKSVLVSTGWNKNDDVFDAASTWAARSTPEDKQFNLMHNENDIIGHITGSYVVDKNGNRIEDDTQPDDFDIITEAVLYNSWTDPENRQRMDQIIAEIQEGKWFVSMECLFAGFDYALLDEQGGAKLLERNEGSAFLTKHLRAYGGNGEYEGYKIGRSLRDISFSGKGLVSKPANPRSIILDSSRAFSLNNTNILTSFPKGDDDMSDINLLEKQLADVQCELASAKEENTTLRAKVEEVTSKEVEESIAKLEETLAQKEEAIKAFEASIVEKEAAYTELHESLEAKDKDFKERMEELKKMKKEKKTEARKAALLDLGLEAEEAEESLASYDELDDATFETVLSAMTKMKKVATKKKEEEAKVEEEKPKAKPKAEETEAEEVEADKAEAEAEEALESVETTEATLVEATETDELEATRASVAEWLENNVLSK
jgi:hypothetical protein